MRYTIVLTCALMSLTPAVGQVSIGIAVPGLSIGLNVPTYPELVPVPGYPVYYAPRMSSNYFFYDGMYWAYQRDKWYSSAWNNGPWGTVRPEVIPVFLLRVPVRYYRQPPVYFHGWRPDGPPHWGEHWGHDWDERRAGWDKWDRRSAPAPAPLPAYQREYTGKRYPSEPQQPELHSRNYGYEPRDPDVKQQYEERGIPVATGERGKQQGKGASPGPGQDQEKDHGKGNGREQDRKD